MKHYVIKIFHDDMVVSPFDDEQSPIKLWAWSPTSHGRLNSLTGTSPDCPDVGTWQHAFYELTLKLGGDTCRLLPVYCDNTGKDVFTAAPGPQQDLVGYLWTTDPTVTADAMRATVEPFTAWYSGQVAEYTIELQTDAEGRGVQLAAEVGFLSKQAAAFHARQRIQGWVTESATMTHTTEVLDLMED